MTGQVDSAESAALRKTARTYGTRVNQLLGENRYDDAYREASKVKMLLEAIPQRDAEVTRLLTASEGALASLRQVGCGEHLLVPALGLPSSPQSPPAQTRPLGPRHLAWIGLALAVLAAMVGGPWYLARANQHRHEVAARQSLTAMQGLLQELRRGMTYRQYVDVLVNQVTPAAMNLRVTSYYTGTRTRASFDALDHAYQVMDQMNRSWRTYQASLGRSDLLITLGTKSEDPGITAMHERWEEADLLLLKARKLMENQD